MRVHYEKKSDGVRVHHKKDNGARVHYGRESAGVRFDHEKRAMGWELTMRKRGLG